MKLNDGSIKRKIPAFLNSSQNLNSSSIKDEKKKVNKDFEFLGPPKGFNIGISSKEK